MPPVLLPMELAIEAAKADLRKKNLAGLDVKILQVPLQALTACVANAKILLLIQTGVKMVHRVPI